MRESALWIDVLVALGAGNLSLGSIHSDSEVVEGLAYTRATGKMRGHVVVNTVPNTVDTAIHELIHRLRPRWSEAKVRAQTRVLMRKFSPVELDAIYRNIHQVAHVRARPIKIDVD